MSSARGDGGESFCHLGPSERLEGSNPHELGASIERANGASPGAMWESIRVQSPGPVSPDVLLTLCLLGLRLWLTVVADAGCGLCA